MVEIFTDSKKETPGTVASIDACFFASYSQYKNMQNR
jgi:hypothetical protein